MMAENGQEDLAIIIGGFQEPLWYLHYKPGQFEDFIEIPGYNAWNDFFVDAVPDFMPETDEDHMKWCRDYYRWAVTGLKPIPLTDSEDQIVITKTPTMKWKNTPIPISLHVLEPSPQKLAYIMYSSTYTPIFPHALSFPEMDDESESDEDSDEEGGRKAKKRKTIPIDEPLSEEEKEFEVRAFYWIVLMKLGSWEPVHPYQMRVAALKLRELCNYPLFKLFNMSCSSTEIISIEAAFMDLDSKETKDIRDCILWNKLMVDLVVHHYIRLKMDH